jgi:hypothetical protein
MESYCEFMTDATKAVSNQPGITQVAPVNASRFHRLMMRSSLALLTSLFFAPVAASAQSVARVKQVSTPQPGIENTVTDEMTAAARSIVALKRLEKDVLVYRSLGDFEGKGKLARVSYQAFRNDLNEVTAEVEAQLARLPESRLKAELGNALASYRDGEFWWQKIDQPRVVNVSALASIRDSRAPSDTALLSTVPYTVAIHWRQAGRYLRSAERLMNGPKPPAVAGG